MHRCESWSAGASRGVCGLAVRSEVQRTIKRAELTAFLCLLTKVIGPIKVQVDYKGIINGLWRGERKCINPKAGDADLWIEIWEEVHNLAARDILVEVEHVKAHHTEKEKKHMSHFEKFVTEGNEKADELAEEGGCIKRRAGDAHLWIKIWEELHFLAARGIVVEVERVKAHRTKKDKKEMPHFEKFVTEGNEKAE